MKRTNTPQNPLSSSSRTLPPPEPLFFRPVLKSKLWGGRRLARLFSPPSASSRRIGEAWLVSGYEGEETVVSEGRFEGETLTSLLQIYGARLVGQNVYARFGSRFPLLIKLIDAEQNLSIQVHPNERVARTLGLPSGKTEMWYVLDARKDASLCIGFNRTITVGEFEQRINDGTLAEVLATHRIDRGDCFLIPSGSIHSIGAGSLLLEIQQSSDATFRVYDYGRCDEDGRQRELHLPQAKISLDFTARGNFQNFYRSVPNAPVLLERTPFFTTFHYQLTEPYELDCRPDRFVVLIATGGRAALQGNGRRWILDKGKAVLIPASWGVLTLEPLEGEFCFVETYVE